MANSEEYNEVEEGINLERYWFLFLSYWKWFVASVICTLAVGCFYILKTTPVYTRTTQLLIKNEDNNGAPSFMQDFKNLGLTDPFTNINNEILTLSAPVMMENVVRRLHLDLEMSTQMGLKHVSLYNNAPINVEFGNALDEEAYVAFNIQIKGKEDATIQNLKYNQDEFEEEFQVKINGDYVKTPVGSIKINTTPSWDDECVGHEILVTKYPVRAIAGAYSNAMSIGLSQKEATVLNLTIRDEIIERADDILLTLIDVYNENWIKDKNRMAESTCTFINERLQNITKDLGDVDEDISNFKSANLLPDMQASLTKDYAQSSRNYETLLQLNNQLSMTKFVHDYLSDDSKQDQLLPSNMGLPSSGVETMIVAYNQMMLERGTILTNSTDDSPMVKDMNRKLAAQKTAILRSLDNLVIQIKKQISNVEKSEKTINNQIASAPRQVKELQSVERQQKVKEALYIFLLQKREENELSRTYTAWNTNIIQPPVGSNFPTSPRKSLILLMSLVLGVLIPAAVIIIRDAMNNKVRGRKDLENMKTPLIGEIPFTGQKKHWWQRNERNTRRIVVETNNRDAVNESFRIVRTKLDYYLRSHADNKVVMFTSFLPNSGKSFTACNLAKACALNGKRVLAIDMDIRHCSLSNVLPQIPKEGITSYLSGSNNDYRSLIIKDAFCEGCDVLPVGIIPPNPTELLYSDRMKTLMTQLREDYDLIFMDCPPIEIVADASIVKDYADVSIFVIRAGLMDRRYLADVDELYTENKYNRLAVLLNGTEYSNGSIGKHQYGYGYGYGYATGYYAGKKKKR